MFKLWNHPEGSCGRIDDFSNLVEALKRRIAKKSRPLANVHNSIRFKPHQSRAGCVGSHWIVGEHDLPHGTRRAVEWSIAFHRHNSVRDNEVDRNCAHRSRMLSWMPFQCRIFFGHPYLAPGTTPNMFFMLSVTPDQWWVLIFGMETRKSASSTVRGSQRCFIPV